MGCWYETCLITRTPIIYDDPVVMIVVSKDYERHELTSLFGIDFTAFRYIDSIKHGLYNDYGWLKDLQGAHTKDMSDRPEPYERSLFIHKKIWNAIVSIDYDKTGDIFYRPFSMDRLRDFVDPELYLRGINEDDIAGLSKVFHFCHLCRINPLAGLAHKGSQCLDSGLYNELFKMEKMCYNNLLKKLEEL